MVTWGYVDYVLGFGVDHEVAYYFEVFFCFYGSEELGSVDETGHVSDVGYEGN